MCEMKVLEVYSLRVLGVAPGFRAPSERDSGWVGQRRTTMKVARRGVERLPARSTACALKR